MRAACNLSILDLLFLLDEDEDEGEEDEEDVSGLRNRVRAVPRPDRTSRQRIA